MRRHFRQAASILTICAVSAAMAPPAEAQSVSDMLNSLFGQPQSSQQRQQRAKQRPEPRAERSEPRRSEPAKGSKAEPAPATAVGLPVTPGEPQLAIVSLGSQNLKFYSGGKYVETAPISSGAKDHRTPTGVFSVIERHRDHESNLYESAPMPFMHRLTWSGIALHQGVLPGHPASHGCIRLPKQFVERLWEISKVGMRVIVSPSPVEPVAVSSPLLFAPKFSPVPDDIAGYLVPERRASNVNGTTVAEAQPDAAASAIKTDAGPSPMLTSSPAAAPDKPKLKLNAQQIAAIKTVAAGAATLNPMQAGVVERIRAQALAPIAQKAADDALAAATAASAKANDALAELRAAEAAFKAAKAKVDAMPVPLAMPAAAPVVFAAADATSKPGDPAAEPAIPTPTQDAKARLDAQRLVLKAKSRLDAAIADEAAKSPAAFAAAENARNAVAIAEDAATQSKVSRKRSEPVTVLISGKDQRMYVRQGMTPVFDAPLIVRPGAEPIGTHVFQAVGASGEQLDWVTVSVPTETLADEVRYSKALRAALTTKHPGDPVDPSIGPAAALRALERFDLGHELTEKLQELVWVGAWIIISEQPLSKETGGTTTIGTDLVVLTK
jgi:lipoprotein-anchoring transpeptidase ErfK/SrfK